MSESRASLRTQLNTAGALLGVQVTVSDDAEWRLDDRGLRVGLGWYGSRGHGDAEAVALAILELWERVRLAQTSPDRVRRQRTLVGAMPWAEPLFAAVLRAQAAAELLVAMPGLRRALTAAVDRTLPSSLRELPGHLQWVVLILEHGFGADASSASPEEGVRARGASGAVRREWSDLPGDGAPSSTAAVLPGFDPVRRVLAADPARSALQRFERALALLLPPYERLLALDSASRGPVSGGSASSETDDAETGTEDPAPGDGDGADPPPGTEDADGEHAERDRVLDPPREPGEERARAGGARDAAEGADLFAAEHAAFVSTVLATPMPARGALVDLLLEPTERAVGSDPAGSPSTGGSDSRASAELALAAYRTRSEELAAPIERMRAVWARVIAERSGRRRAPGRRALPDGDELMPEALAAAVAAAHAGASRPDGFRRRETRVRRTRRAGSTDYVLLIDRSASMSGAVSEAAADAALIMVEGLAGAERDIAHAEASSLPALDLDLDLRTALIVFDARAHVVKPLSSGLDDGVRRELYAAIRSPAGATNDGAALATAAEQLGIGGARPSGTGLERRRVVIVLSDGGSNDPVAAEHALRRLRASGVRVHGIGIGSDEVVRRYAPTSLRIDRPAEIADALRRLVEDGLP